MIGLLKKDLYVADKSSRLLVVLALVFCLAPGFGSLGSTYAMMMAFMLPMNSIAYDERCKWDRYAAMLPCRPSQIVWCKYLLSGIYTLLGEVIILAGAAVRHIMKPGSVDWQSIFELNLMLALVMFLVISITLPFLFRFGSEKGRLIMLVVMAMGVGTAVASTNAIFGDRDLVSLLPPVPVLVTLGAALVIGGIYVSFRLSVHFYRKRQNGAYD